MIVKNRKFERKEPDRDAKCIFIFCEGAKRERQYFNFFNGIDSRIKIEVYKLDPHDDNSPLGLFEIAQEAFESDKGNCKPKYEFQDGDEVWIVLDIDLDQLKSREVPIDTVDTECNKLRGWFLVKSNPCFEVWLYNHLFSDMPEFDGIEYCENWKHHVDEKIPGGFNSLKHPILIEDAIENAGNLFQEENGTPAVGCTDLFKMAKSIVSIAGERIRKERLETVFEEGERLRA